MAVMGGTAAFVIGLTTQFFFNYVGKMIVAEDLLILLLPFLIVLRGKKMARRDILPILILVLFWLTGQIITDIYREIAWVDRMRGMGTIIFFGIDLLALLALVGKSDTRKVCYLIGYVLSVVLVTIFAPDEYMQAEPWKFGYGPSVTIAVLLVSCVYYRRRRYKITMLILLGIASIHLLLNIRSAVLLLLVTLSLIVPLVPERVGRWQILPPVGSFSRSLALLVIAFCAAGIAGGAVLLATKSGLVSESSRKKNERQSQLIGGILIGGRPEILVSSQAVLDSPILGHGSWARDPKYVEMLQDIMAQYGTPFAINYYDEAVATVIPAHSYFFGSWVSAGIMGAVFWAYILYLNLKGIVRLPLLRPPLAPVYGYLLVGMFWGILFSPFSNNARIISALTVVIIIDLLETELPGGGNAGPRILESKRGRLGWRPSLL